MNFGGTSAATPLAAGIAALMLSRNPSLTAAEVRNVMHNTCDKIGFDPYINGVAEHYGYGRVNAARAVAAALPTISAAGITLQEGLGGAIVNVTLSLTLSASTVRDVTVSYATADGTAISGTNYVPANGMVTIPAGATTGSINLSIGGTAMAQPKETFFVNLTNPANAILARNQVTIVVKAHDSDGDGMADYWEVLHGFNPNDPTDASQDTDGDGRSNLQEFIDGTDPNNASDYLKISALESIPGGIRIRFQTVIGRAYDIQQTGDLINSTWTTWTEVTGTGAEVQVDDAGAGGNSTKQFYRVLVEN
jgi:hypothetical protein